MRQAQTPKSSTLSPITGDLFSAWLISAGVAPHGWKYNYEHFRRIAQLMDAVFGGKEDRVRIHMPPRHGKTQTVTIRGALYLLLHQPGVRILITAYNMYTARKFSRALRNEYEARGRKLAKDKRSSDEWETLDKSLVVARGVGSPPTGEGFDYIFVDDPIRKREDAESKRYRDKQWDWYTDDLLTRLQPDGRIIMCFTRWHEDDIGGRLDAAHREGGDKWTILKLPAINKKGKALWPEVWSIEKLKRRQRAMVRQDGQRSWEALFQQNPTPVQGDILKTDRFVFVDSVPAGLKNVRAWDAGASEAKGDYTASVKMDGPCAEGKYYISNARRARYGPGKRDRFILDTANEDGTDVPVLVPQDPGAAGKAQVAAWVKLLAGFWVKTVIPTGTKETRIGPFAAQLENGNVCIVRGTWNADYIEELRTFPGTHDDWVDATADAFNEIAEPVGEIGYGTLDDVIEEERKTEWSFGWIRRRGRIT